jgi:hypothetical protein
MCRPFGSSHSKVTVTASAASAAWPSQSAIRSRHEVKELRDKAIAFETYARQARNVEAERQACEIRLRAERRCGQLLQEMEKAKGAPGNQYTGPLDRREGSKTLADHGVSYDQSSRWQKLADIPEEEFEQRLRGSDKAIATALIWPEEKRGRPAKNVENLNINDDRAMLSKARAIVRWSRRSFGRRARTRPSRRS